MKAFLLLLSAGLVSYFAYFNKGGQLIPEPFSNTTDTKLPVIINRVFTGNSVTSVSDVVTKALAFKAMLTTTQQTTLQQAYTNSLARKWSNLPCGSGCRNGVQFSTLTAAQLTAALTVIQSASGANANEGYDEFLQVRAAEEVLQAQAGGNNYDEGNYWISFLNTPSTTSGWMLQYGGHHYAANIAFNAGNVVGTTPLMEGVEPALWVTNGITYAPLNTELTSMRNMLSSLTATQLTTAKLTGTFSDVLLSPGETNGNANTFPTTKVGIPGSALTTAQKDLVLTAIQAWLQDVDASSAAELLTVYTNDINSTYIGWTGSGTSGTPSTFLNANTNYVRIDGPSVWIEFVCQNGVVFTGIHYHSVWRDHFRDYGADLTRITLPVKITSFGASIQNGKRIISWVTSEERNSSHFEIEYSAQGTNFIKIGTVAAINTSLSKKYSFVDNVTVPESSGYYRLKIVDVDGNSEYTGIAMIRNGLSKGVSITPNPAVDQISVNVPTAMSNATIKISDSRGRDLMTLKNISGYTKILSVVDLPAGFYVLSITDGEITNTTKFVKK